MKKYSLMIIFILLIPNISQFEINQQNNIIEEIIIIPDNDPYYGIIGSNLAFNYSIINSNNIKPLLIQKEGKLTNIQDIFIDNYLDAYNKGLLVLGEKIDSKYQTNEILGNISKVSIEAAKNKYPKSSSIMIIPYGKELDYKLSLIASPISNYLNIPIVIFNNNNEQINELCRHLEVKEAYVIGDIKLELNNINVTTLRNVNDIQNINLEIIKEKFGKINYITITNPSDTIAPYIINQNNTKINDSLKNIKITLFGKQYDIIGYDNKYYQINISNGLNILSVYANITKSNFSLFNDSVIPIIYLNIYDNNNNLIGYSSSLGNDFGKSYLEAFICDSPGTYNIQIICYNGIKGGYFSQRGISITDVDYQIAIKNSELEKPHMPIIPKLSMLAPYLTSAHGGIIIADSDFELTDENYSEAGKGSSAGPWYEEKLHEYNNKKVNYTIDKLNETLNQINQLDMLEDYLNGPAWLAILGDTNMIPMFYYSPSQQGILEKGLPSDNPYYLNFNLSVGRVISYNIQDASNLISRTIFYEKICKDNISNESWHNKFNFIFGEGFGETGGIFHQIPYSKEIQQYGFKTEVYGDLRNSREISEKLEVYTNSNYIEYLGHGDWFWFTPSLYGFDIYSKAIDVAHAKYWVYDNPSIFLTSACLMSRIDGIPSYQNIGLTMLHIGCNAFIGATRETGQEAGLELIENHLIIDDLSVGEALREEKKIDKELPTYYVRTLYGDPAFNPYEPNNGFSNQGIQ